MRHFIIAVLTGVIFAIVGTSLLVIFSSNPDLNCRDCQNAVGAILLIITGVAVGLFLIGVVVGGVFSYYLKKVRQDTPNAEVKLDVTGNISATPFFTTASIKKIIALILIFLILIVFFLNALSN